MKGETLAVPDGENQTFILHPTQDTKEPTQRPHLSTAEMSQDATPPAGKQTPSIRLCEDTLRADVRKNLHLTKKPHSDDIIILVKVQGPFADVFPALTTKLREMCDTIDYEVYSHSDGTNVAEMSSNQTSQQHAGPTDLLTGWLKDDSSEDMWKIPPLTPKHTATPPTTSRTHFSHSQPTSWEQSQDATLHAPRNLLSHSPPGTLSYRQLPPTSNPEPQPYPSIAGQPGSTQDPTGGEGKNKDVKLNNALYNLRNRPSDGRQN